MDNVVMILAGDQIDYHLGSKFGLHTLTAAGFGQVISDVMGVPQKRHLLCRSLAVNRLDI